MDRQRIHEIIAAIVGVLGAGLLSGQILNGNEYSELRLIVRSTAYWGVNGGTYTPPNCQRGGSIFFPGEPPIPFRIEIINTTEASQLVVTSADEPARAVAFTTTWEAEPLTESGTSVPAALPLSVEPVAYRSDRSGQVAAVNWARRIRLEPGESLELRVHVEDIALSPGFYAVNVFSQMTDEASRPIRPQFSRYQFEIREVTPDARIELALRRASRAWLARDDSEAQGLTEVLLELHPTSFAAHMLRGRMAEQRKQWEEAIRHDERALTILEQGLDTLFVKSAICSYPPRVEGTIEGLRQEIARLRDLARQ